MEKVNFTKSMKEVYVCYLKSDTTCLSDVYKSYSVYKEDAYRYCRNLYCTLNGENFKIIGANCNTFSVGFTYKDIENKTHFVYITKEHDRDCIIN